MTTTAAETLEIRPASWEDMETVANFIRSTADWYRPFLEEEDMVEHDVPPEWKAKNFARRAFYLGVVDDQPVGTISLQDFGDYAYVGYVYLDADHVGNGYGRQLLDFAAGLASRKGKEGLALIAHPEATWATKAYEKFGFEKESDEKQEILEWNDGALEGYYEEGFELYLYRFDS
ncbi:MAG: GNAT family N-acetyltransferase [Planctomycetota bacterium]